MNPLGPHLTVFLREYLPSQREMSTQTSDTYAYAFQLLVCFAAKRLKTTPSKLSIEQLDATLVLAFLESLEVGIRFTHHPLHFFTDCGLPPAFLRSG